MKDQNFHSNPMPYKFGPKCGFQPYDPIFFSIFRSPDALGCENRCPTPVSVSYISVSLGHINSMVEVPWSLNYLILSKEGIGNKRLKYLLL